MGTGINKIRALLRDAGAPGAHFEFGNFFTVIFPRTFAASEETSLHLAGKTSGKILELIGKDPFITIAELSLKIGISNRSIERNIEKLQTNGLLKRIGPTKGGKWEIASYGQNAPTFD